MNINYDVKNILQINDARIVYRNFTGAASKFNRAGDRNFAVVIPTEELAEELLDKGWRVKIKPPREDGDSPFMYLPVKIKFNERGPRIYLKTGETQVLLDEETVSCIDEIDISSVSMDLRPFDWEVNGNTGRTAYLQVMQVVQDVDRFAE